MANHSNHSLPGSSFGAAIIWPILLLAGLALGAYYLGGKAVTGAAHGHGAATEQGHGGGGH